MKIEFFGGRTSISLWDLAIAVGGELCGMDDGIPSWMGGYREYKERMQCYGNAVSPQQFYPVFKAIAEVEKGGGSRGRAKNVCKNHY